MRAQDSRPIWVQLIETYRRYIASGHWAPSDKIPSVRELALESGVNPNTVQRALTELDREGLTVPERAQGRFVTSDHAVIAATRQYLAQEATAEHVQVLQALNMPLEEALDMLKKSWSPRTAPPK